MNEVMDLLTTISDMRRWTNEARSRGETIGFVPTMGGLHEGHLSLVGASVAENDKTVASIFVNPAQFNDKKDLEAYPRNLEQDAAKLENEGCSALFTVADEAMYPAEHETWVDVDRLPDHLCGLDRPGHFRGVTTVVTKLFNIVDPHRAYFGWKDAQQAIIIKRMVQDLNFSIEIRCLPTVRDADGLALSSRNARLTSDERQKALVIPRAIENAKDFYRAKKRSRQALLSETESIFQGAPGLSVDYISLVAMSDLEEASEVAPGTMLALAARVGQTRLIDNCRFTEDRSCSDS